MPANTMGRTDAWTPGPWRYESSNSDVVFENETDGNRMSGTICTVYARGERQRANAKLIAKAPEMAEMLVKLSAICERLCIALEKEHTYGNGGHEAIDAMPEAVADEYAAHCRIQTDITRILREAGAL